MDGQGGGGFGGDHGGGFGGHHHGGHHGGSVPDGGAALWIRQTYGRDAARPEDLGGRSRVNSRWWLLLVAVLAVVALAIPLMR